MNPDQFQAIIFKKETGDHSEWSVSSQFQVIVLHKRGDDHNMKLLTTSKLKLLSVKLLGLQLTRQTEF